MRFFKIIKFPGMCIPAFRTYLVSRYRTQEMVEKKFRRHPDFLHPDLTKKKVMIWRYFRDFLSIFSVKYQKLYSAQKDQKTRFLHLII